jgi:ABC-type sulfate transport system permease subunit
MRRGVEKLPLMERRRCRQGRLVLAFAVASWLVAMALLTLALTFFAHA